MTFTCRVYGLPVAQGSKHPFRNKATGKIQMVESSKRLKPWRQEIAAVATDQMSGPPWTTPVSVWANFIFSRPAGHYGSGRQANVLKPSAPGVPAGRKNDLEKLVRALHDALTGIVFRDDGQVVQLHAQKVYGDRPAVEIEVTQLNDTAEPL